MIGTTEFLPDAFSLKADELAETTALMFGRRSYEAFATTWPDSDDLVFPVLLGAGKSLFSRSDRDRQVLTLRQSESYPNGVLKLIYDVSG